ncbi:hypothetical protein U9M48_024810 [Paspalum notatum var. saurae]|uniref:Uncharacterized protein n=1 Tax=Paspalum notatum var. saurae TaxID=547442 RepID=A0AAQ3WWD0_PASNO
MISSLLYLTATRPDIQFAVCLCARYQASPRTSHRQAVKRIFRYLKFTPELGLWYSSGSSLSLRGFSDADHAGCRIDRKSTSGTCQLLGTSLVSWSSRKQACVSLSTTEAEFGKIPLLVDSTSAISVAKNPVLHSRTKYIDRDHYEKGDIDLIHVATENQLADIFTKPLELSAFACLRGELGFRFCFYLASIFLCFFCILYHIMHCTVSYARTMLDEHRTPRHFWAEEVNTACYIANRIFLRSFLGKTSYELRFGRQPSVRHLRAFGCRCHLHFTSTRALLVTGWRCVDNALIKGEIENQWTGLISFLV